MRAHKIVLNFNKKSSPKRRERAKPHRRAESNSERTSNQLPVDRIDVLFTHLIAMPFTYLEIFFMFINFISTLEQREKERRRKAKICCCAVFFAFQSLDVLFFKRALFGSCSHSIVARRVNNNNGFGGAVNFGVRRAND
jgi:hypothetical protein